MKRRDFLKTGGIAGTAGLVLDGCARPQQLIPLLISEDRFVPGEEGWVRTLCQQCSAGCGITVRVMQGESIRTIDGQQKRVKAVQAKKIEGNPDHPISMGGTCARGQAGVQALYHPDRIQTPLRLTGPRGSGQYQPTTWKEAQQLLVTQLQQQIGTPQAIAFLTGRPNRGTMGTVIDRFAAGLGTTNVVSYDPFDPAPLRKAMELMTGVAELPAADFANANFLLSINANLFETFLSPVRHNYSYGQFRQGRPGLRGKFVHAEPRLSQTAACADEWLPIRPGTEGLLALAMAHIIVGEKLYDADFVAANTNGFAEWSSLLAGCVNTAGGERICRAASQRGDRRQPRRGVSHCHLCAECARRRIRTAGRISSWSRRGWAYPGRRHSGIRRQTQTADPRAGRSPPGHPRAHRRHGRQSGEGAARVRHQPALHTPRSGKAALGARQRALRRELRIVSRRNVDDGRFDSS
jgi:anaerobic selenocysteine-containing dehydrogenase